MSNCDCASCVAGRTGTAPEPASRAGEGEEAEWLTEALRLADFHRWNKGSVGNDSLAELKAHLMSHPQAPRVPVAPHSCGESICTDCGVAWNFHSCGD